MTTKTLLKALLYLGLVCAAHSQDDTQKRCETMKLRFQNKNCDAANLTQSCEWLHKKIVKFCNEENTTNCASTPCQNGATCVDDGNGFNCQCQAGYTGQTCDTGGNITTCQDRRMDFTCPCQYGSTRPIDLGHCASAPCKNGAYCENQATNFTCHCRTGYTGQTCETDVDDCASSPCHNCGTCVDKLNGYTCQCLQGFSGKTCQLGRSDWVESNCTSNSDCPSDIHAECFEGRCLCTIGYYYSNCRKVCVIRCPEGDLQHDQYLTYPDHFLDHTFRVQWGTKTLDACREKCTQTVTCRAFQMTRAYGSWFCFFYKDVPPWGIDWDEPMAQLERAPDESAHQKRCRA